MDYSFLSSLSVEDTRETKKREKTERIPTGYTIRVFRNGAAYPSKELTQWGNLEYNVKTADDNNLGNGFDVIDSSKWKLLQGQPRMLMFGLVNRSFPKISLFSRTKHNEDGTPVSSVLTQGAINEELRDLCWSFGYLNDKTKYVDLEFVMAYPFTPKDGIAYVPKLIEKGPQEGKETYERRDNMTFYAVQATPVELTIKEQETKNADTEITVNN